jgi:hypothetical protein
MQTIPQEVLNRILIYYDGADQPYLISLYFAALWSKLVNTYLSLPVTANTIDVIGIYKSSLEQEPPMKIVYIGQTLYGHVSYAMTGIRNGRLFRMRENWSLLLDGVWKCDIRLIVGKLPIFHCKSCKLYNIMPCLHVEASCLYNESTLYLTWLMHGDDGLSFPTYLMLCRTHSDASKYAWTGWNNRYNYMNSREKIEKLSAGASEAAAAIC